MYTDQRALAPHDGRLIARRGRRASDIPQVMTTDAHSLPAVYAALLNTENRAADTALATALPEVEPEVQPQVVEMLIERDNERALAQVAAAYASYDLHLRGLVAARGDRFSGGLRRCITGPSIEVRESAIELIRDCGDCRLAYLLAEALAQPCRRTVQRAAETLLSLTERAIRGSTLPVTTRAGVPHCPVAVLIGAVRQGLRNWPLHYRMEVVRAAALLSAYVEDAILEAVADPRRKVARSFDNLIRSSQDPLMSALVLASLRARELREAACRNLGRPHDPAVVNAYIDAAWMLADNRIRVACARVRSLGALEHAVPASEHAPRRARGLVRLLTFCKLGHARRADLLRSIIQSGSPAASRAAIWSLVENPFEGSGELLQSVAARQDGPLARVARLELIRRAGGRFATADMPPAVACDAATASPVGAGGSRQAFEMYWREFDSLAIADRVAIGHAIVESTPSFTVMLERQFAAPAAPDRLRAVRVVRELELVRQFEDQVYAAARDADHVVRSMAVSLLGELDTPVARRILREALSDSDDRVQANAVEVLARLDVEDKREQLAAKLRASNSRVRGNAVKALLDMRVRDGAVRLVEMLVSERGADRLTALWVVERLNMAGLAERIATMAESDPDPRVRRRARRLLEQIGISTTAAVSGRLMETAQS